MSVIPNGSASSYSASAPSLSKVLQKGMRVAASGDFQLNEWEKNGEKRVSVELIANDIEPLFDKREGGGERQQSRGGQASSGGGFGDYNGDPGDDVPF
jgi:single-stranded DNA-binding protein